MEETYALTKHLKIIFVDGFDTLSINSPVRVEKDFPGKFLPQNGAWYILGDNQIYHFDFQKLVFDNITDSVINLNSKLKESGFEKILWSKVNNETVFSITSSNGREYFYHPLSQTVYDEESAQNIEPQDVVNKNAVREKNPISFYNDGKFILRQYEKNGTVFFQKIDINGNEIWTKKSDYQIYEKSNGLYIDSLAIIRVLRRDESDKKTDCFLFVRKNGDEIKYVKMRN